MACTRTRPPAKHLAGLLLVRGKVCCMGYWRQGLENFHAMTVLCRPAHVLIVSASSLQATRRGPSISSVSIDSCKTFPQMTYVKNETWTTEEFTINPQLANVLSIRTEQHWAMAHQKNYGTEEKGMACMPLHRLQRIVL